MGRRWRPTTRPAADTLARGCTEAWVKDIVAVNQCKGPGLHFPIIADPERTVAHALGMIDEKARDAADVPLLAYDLGDSRNGKPPFRFAEEHPPEEALCSCPNLAQPTTPPRHALCTFCPA